MTEIETEVKVEQSFERPIRTNSNAFSSRAFSSSVDNDLKNFDTYKPTDLNLLFNKLERNAETKQEKKTTVDTDLDRFTKLENEDFPVVMSKTVAVEEPKVALKINLKGKLIIFVASVALVLFTFLAIFNAVTISKLNASISQINEEISVKEIVLNEKVETYNALTDGALLETKASGLGFAAIDGENVHTLSFKEVNQTSSADAKSNWFNSLCDWVAQLFGE